MPAIEFFKPLVSDLALFNADWNPAVLSVSSAVSLAIWHWVTCQSKPDFAWTGVLTRKLDSLLEIYGNPLRRIGLSVAGGAFSQLKASSL